MLRWLVELISDPRPCKRRLEAEVGERKRLMEENTRLARQAAAAATRTNRKLRNVSLVMILQTADEVGEAFRGADDREGGGHDPARGQ